jgi:hypothetical protein
MGPMIGLPSRDGRRRPSKRSLTVHCRETVRGQTIPRSDGITVRDARSASETVGPISGRLADDSMM